MSEETYNIVFRGQTVKNVAVEQAKKNLATLFNMNAQKIDVLFSGKPVVLKKNVSFDVATKYRVAIKKAGGIVELEPVKIKEETPKEKPKRAVFGVKEPAPLGSEPTADSNAALNQTKTADEPSGLSLQPLQGGSAQAKNVEAPKSVDVDVSGIQLSPAEGLLVESHEHVKPEPVKLEDSNLSVAENIGNLVKPDEIKRPEPVAVDVSNIALSKAGESLEKKEEKSYNIPDVSHLSLSDM